LGRIAKSVGSDAPTPFAFWGMLISYIVDRKRPAGGLYYGQDGMDPPTRGEPLWNTMAMGNPLNTAEPQESVQTSGVWACVFDAYGTLFDFAAAARKCRDVVGDNVQQLTTLSRDKQLQYIWLRAAQGRHADFWQVTGDALDFSLDTLNLSTPGLRDRLMALEAFPEERSE
jgi:hypothetical protein